MALAGFTLAEVIIAIAISVVAFAGVIKCYTQTAQRAQWSGYSLAAQALAIKELEQARSAVWDITALGNRNELTNLNLMGWTYNATTQIGTGYSIANLDLPVMGTNVIRATNFVTVRMVPLTGFPTVSVQMVRVDTVWPFKFGKFNCYTNTVANYFAPDNSTL
jgi:hypothetical protein